MNRIIYKNRKAQYRLLNVIKNTDTDRFLNNN